MLNPSHQYLKQNPIINTTILHNGQNLILTNMSAELDRYIEKYVIKYYGIENKTKKFTVIGQYNGCIFNNKSIVTRQPYFDYLNSQIDTQENYKLILTGIGSAIFFLISFSLPKEK